MQSFPAASCKGRLLVAAPPLEDPNFDRTVVYLLEHTADGAIGVVLNRPTPDALPEEVTAWEPFTSTPSCLFYGGPVDPNALIALGAVPPGIVVPEALADDDSDDAHPANATPDPGATLVTDGIVSVDLAASPYALDFSLTDLRVFRGYSGWGPLQLDTELAQQAWVVVDAAPTDLFHGEPTALWREVLARQRGSVAWLAKAPDDLSMN